MRRGVVVLLLAGAALFPAAYGKIAERHDARLGAAQADLDWQSHSAVIVSADPVTFSSTNGIEFRHFVDANGLVLVQSWLRRTEKGYNNEIQRLISADGTPPWSSHRRPIPDEVMADMVTAADFRQVDSYPCVLSPNLVLLRGGGITPWGTNEQGSPGRIDIMSRREQRSLFLDFDAAPSDPAFVCRRSQFPDLIFVRCGGTVIAATRDGWIIQEAIVSH